ncbi:hypothetical protein B0H15DRAFT_48438 [Mycena belliarum]|uniref:Uncharacterized protein n=1 Tax=Mycena belliarum TaxID=1033014 RepID=A0AAD6XIV9_9AGAR|nr:hypothetical protein B0H15DRAFT_48438 [Mycena belliae]
MPALGGPIRGHQRRRVPIDPRRPRRLPSPSSPSVALVAFRHPRCRRDRPRRQRRCRHRAYSGAPSLRSDDGLHLHPAPTWTYAHPHRHGLRPPRSRLSSPSCSAARCWPPAYVPPRACRQAVGHGHGLSLPHPMLPHPMDSPLELLRVASATFISLPYLRRMQARPPASRLRPIPPRAAPASFFFIRVHLCTCGASRVPRANVGGYCFAAHPTAALVPDELSGPLFAFSCGRFSSPLPLVGIDILYSCGARSPTTS